MKSTDLVNRTINNGEIRDTKEVDIDEAINLSGSFGRYQWLVNIFLNMIHVIFNPHLYILYFVADDPPWTCVKKSSSLFCKQHFGEKIPQSSELFEKRCDLNRSEWMFVKDKTYSIVTEYDLVCDYTWMGSLANAPLFIGWGLSGPFVGYLSDAYGRRVTSIMSVLLGAFSLAGLSFINDMWQFILLRGLLGAGIGCYIAMFYTICTEVVGNKYRAITGVFLAMTTLAGNFVLPYVAYSVPHWRKLVLYISLPVVMAVLISLFIPETARWLCSSGKIKEAENKLKQIAKFNRKDHVDIKLQKHKLRTNDEPKKYSYVDILFRHFSVSILVISLCFDWAVAALLYFGLTLESSDLGGSIYFNFTLSFVAEVPNPILFLYCSNKIGRKQTFLLFSFIGSVSVSIVGVLYFVHEGVRGLDTAKLILAMIGKLCVATCFSVLYLWTFELFPTVVRSQGLIFCQIAGRVGAAGAPFIATNLAESSKPLPFIVMGAAGFLSALCGCWLPETNGRKTRENYEDFFDISSRNLVVQSLAVEEKIDEAPLLSPVAG